MQEVEIATAVAFTERLMRTLVLVEVEVLLQRREQIGARGEVAGVDQLVFERAPQTFDENIVDGAAACT